LVTGWAYYPPWSMSCLFPRATLRVNTYMGLIPLPERSSVDLDNGPLDEGVRSDKLVVGSVVNLQGVWS